VVYANESPAQTLTLHLPERRKLSTPVLFVPYGQYFPELVAYFTEQGYPVVSVSTRGGTFRTEMEDSLCALAFIHAEAGTFGLDPTRIVSVGASLGGGVSVALAAADDVGTFMEGCEYTLPEASRAAGVILLAGVLDFSFPEDFPSGYIPQLTNYMEGTPEENPAVWEFASSVTHIDGGDPPFLLLHGTADRTVEPHQSQYFSEALEAAGVEYELMLLPRLSHEGLFSSEEAFSHMLAFLEHFVQ
jgi:acetyl esterase/lipase